MTRNQRNNNGVWMNLGRYFFTAGIDCWVEVQSSSGGNTVADAARFDYTLLPLPVIIDNADTTAPNYFSVVSGTWPTRVALENAYGTNYRIHTGDNSGAEVRWIPEITDRGYYSVYIWWPDATSEFATNSHFTVGHALGTNLLYMDQQVNGGKWNYHGTYFFELGTGGYIKLTDKANGKVIADAVKLVREGN